MSAGLTIDEAEFEKGKPARALYDQILEFLTKNSGKAYAEAEITREMLQASGEHGILKTLTSVGIQTLMLGVLDNLVADGKVTARRPGVFMYHMAAKLGAESKEEAAVATAGELKRREGIPEMHSK